jgi:hypothetical protein
MKRKLLFKQLTAFAIALIMTLVGFNTVAVSTDPSAKDPAEFFSFISDSKMDSNGDFSFSFRFSLTSDKFKPVNTTIHISTRAHLKAYDGTGTISYSTSRTMTVSLYKDGLFGSYIGGYTTAADGVTRGETFYNLKTNKKYYIVLQSNDPSLETTSLRFEGTGNATLVNVV